MSPVQVVCLDSDSEPDERHIVPLDSDSESDAPRRPSLESVSVKSAKRNEQKQGWNQFIVPDNELNTLVACFRKRKPFSGTGLPEKFGAAARSKGSNEGLHNGRTVSESTGNNGGANEGDLTWLHTLREPVVGGNFHGVGDAEPGILYDNVHEPDGGKTCPVAEGNQRKRSWNGRDVESGPVTAGEKARILAQKQAEKAGEKQRKVEARALEKARKEEEKKARLESNRLQREEDKRHREEAKHEAAERRKLEKEKTKWEKGKFAIENTVAHIDSKVLEKGKIGGAILTRLGDKTMTFIIGSNPISKTIIWSSKRPCDGSEEDSQDPTEEADNDCSQADPCRSSQLQLEDFVIPYVLVILEAEEFSDMVATCVLHEHVQRIQQQYPGFPICYLVNRLMRYLHQKDQAQYKQASASWMRPPVEQALAQLVTHHTGVHSRLCLDEAEVADHVVGLMQNLAAVPFKRKISALSISQNGEHVVTKDPNRALIKKSTWLRALVALPRLSGGCAVAIAKKYPNMRALLNVYLDPNMSVRDKEFLLQDLVKEAPIGSVRSRVRVGPACSKRVYRIFMAQNGQLLTDEVEEGADMFDD